MALYKSEKTGTLIRSDHKISGEKWKTVEEKNKKRKKEDKPPEEATNSTSGVGEGNE